MKCERLPVWLWINDWFKATYGCRQTRSRDPDLIEMSQKTESDPTNATIR